MVSKLERWKTAAERTAHRKAQAKYQKKPEEVEKRENRNQARYQMEKAGKVRKGDNKDVEHKDGNALNENPMNWRVGTRHHNRSYRRNRDASKKDPRS